MAVLSLPTRTVHACALLGLGLAAALLLRAIFRKSARALRLPPGPCALPVLGNLHQIGLPPAVGLTRLAKTHGDIMFVKLGALPAVVIGSPRALKLFHIDHGVQLAYRPQGMDAFSIMSSNNTRTVVASSGDVWRKGRKLHVQHLLAKHKLPDYEGLILQETRAMEQSDIPGDGVVADITLPITKLFASIMLRLCYGTAFASASDPRFLRLYAALDRIFLLLNNGNPADFFPFLKYFPSSFKSELSKQVEEVYALNSLFLEEMRRSMANAESQGSATTKCMATELLEIAKEEQLTDDTIGGLLADMLGAGIETSAILVSWVLICLANHPDVQQRVRDEIEESLGERPCTAADEAQLPLLTAVIWETLRYVVLLPLPLPRELQEPVTIDGFDIPRGTAVFVNLHACMTDPAQFPDPDRFLPERFLDYPSDPLSCSDPSFAPFNVGARQCPGARLSMLEMHIVLCELLRHYDIRRTTAALIPIKPNSNLVVKPADPVSLLFERRPPASHAS